MAYQHIDPSFEAGEEKQSAEHRPTLPHPIRNRPALVLRYAAMVIIAYSLFLFGGYTVIPSWYALPTAAAPMLTALLLHNMKKLGAWRYAASVLLNAAATGLAASTYFRALSLPLPHDFLLLGAVMLFLLLIPAYLFAGRFDTKRQQAVIAGTSLAFFIGALVALIVLWCTHPREDVLYALLTFDLIFFSFYYLAFFVAATDDDTDTERLVSFWSFSLALSIGLVAGVAVAAALGGDCDCDCDGCDCIDCGDTGARKKKKTHIAKST